MLEAPDVVSDHYRRQLCRAMERDSLLATLRRLGVDDRSGRFLGWDIGTVLSDAGKEVVCLEITHHGHHRVVRRVVDSEVLLRVLELDRIDILHETDCVP